jgi:hypothetical protein
LLLAWPLPFKQDMTMNRIKFSLDCLLLAAFLLLMDPRSFYGLTFHEWAGLAIGAFFIVHILLSWGFVRTITLGFFGHARQRPRVNYVLDVVLLLSMGAAIVSGLPIARTMDFSWMGFSRSSTLFWRTLHTSSSMITLVLVGVHLGLHWSWVVARIRPAVRRANS